VTGPGAELDYRFRAMGSDVRLLVGPRLVRCAPDPLSAADREKAFVLDFAHRLSRFRIDSELTRLNRDPRYEVRASPLLRAAVRAGLWAAQRSDGLLDPTLVRELEHIGYNASLDGAEPAPLAEALAGAPPRRAARPAAQSRWREIEVDDEAGVIRRPPGTMIDTGGTGKGLCADAVAHRLAAYTRCVVDCGGDIAVGGVGAQLEPYAIEIEHPLTAEPLGYVELERGGIATSGLNVRIWRDRDGRFAHHLLDPSTGTPAWTGVIGATALGGTALEAETLSKMALLGGVPLAREVLSVRGGVIVDDGGTAHAIGPVAASIFSPARVG
jgi:thiamine biosynthesis lipoprotein